MQTCHYHTIPKILSFLSLYNCMFSVCMHLLAIFLSLCTLHVLYIAAYIQWLHTCSMCNTITVVTPLCYAGIYQIRQFLQRWLLWSITGIDSFKRILKADYVIIAFKQSNWSYITIYSLYYYSYILWQSYILVLYNSLRQLDSVCCIDVCLVFLLQLHDFCTLVYAILNWFSTKLLWTDLYCLLPRENVSHPPTLRCFQSYSIIKWLARMPEGNAHTYVATNHYQCAFPYINIASHKTHPTFNWSMCTDNTFNRKLHTCVIVT